MPAAKTEGMKMSESKNGTSALDAIELLGMAGCSFFFGWMLVTFYWLFAVFVPNYPNADRDFIQLFIFLGVACGYLMCHLAGKFAKRTIFQPSALAIELIFGSSVSIASIALYLGAEPPSGVLCAANFLSGVSGAMLTVAWLDTCGRMPSKSYSRFIAASFLAGGALLLVVSLMPAQFQAGFCLVYLVLSVGFSISPRRTPMRKAPCPKTQSSR